MTKTHSSRPSAGLRSSAVKGMVMTVALLPVVAIAPLRAEEVTVEMTPLGVQLEPSPLLAQADNEQTILNFDTTNYAVRVYQRNTQTRMRVFSRRDDRVILDEAAVFVPNSGRNNAFSSYRSIGSFSAQPARFFARVDAVNNTQLEIFDAQNNLIRQENGGTNPVVALPPDQRPPNSAGNNQPSEANTRLAFVTASFATRVYEDNGILKMNVYTRDNQPLQNGVAASPVLNPQSPYESWVSYVSNGSFQGIPVRYFSRISGRGETLLEIVEDASGRTLLSQPGIGPVTINIPPSEIPPTAETPVASENLDPYIAAVFGDANTLERLQSLQQSATASGIPLQEPRFEEAPQGRFINAGSYRNRDEAAAVVNFLRSRNFNSRLVFRDFRYR